MDATPKRSLKARQAEKILNIKRTDQRVARIDELIFRPYKALRLVVPHVGSATVIPELGGILNDLVFEDRGVPVSVIDGYSDMEEYRELYRQSYRGAKLFPFPNRINNGRYIWQGKHHQLIPNFESENNAIHGLISDASFRVIESLSSDAAQIKLKTVYDGTKPGFPFTFEVFLTYLLDANGLSIRTQVLNTGNDEIPFGDGWHHYFKLPGKVDDWNLQLPSVEQVINGPRMIPSGKMLKVDPILGSLEGRSFDDCFVMERSNITDVCLSNPKTQTQLRLSWDTEVYPYCQIYTPPSRQSIAIEPMTCAPDVFNNHMGIRSIKPGEEWESELRLYSYCR